jgi:hypothetical protein
VSTPFTRIPAPTGRRVFVLFALLVVAFKWPVLDEPPVWDASMSVFPAAITLTATDFDLAGLLDQPGYLYGGPNVHALSLVTWITGVAYHFLGPRPAVVLPVLHLLHFAVGALALTALWRLATRVMGAWPALLVTSALFCLPLLQVQLGTVYLELPVLAATAVAVDAWVGRSLARAGLWATVATLVKPTGAIVAGGLALASLLAGGPWRRRFRDAAAVLAGPAVVAALVFLLQPGDGVGFARLGATVIYLRSVPDVALILALFITLFLADRWRGPSAEADPGAATASRAHLAFAGLFVSFFAFFALLVPLGSSVPILPRYYLQIVPFAFIGGAALLKRRLPPRAAVALLLVVGSLSLVNRYGRLYPYQGLNNFAIAERSMAYTDLLQLQRLGLEQLVARSATEPVFYSLPDHYKLSYPAMGYGIPRPSEGHCILNESPFHAGRLQHFPATFSTIFEFPWLGGEVAMQVVRQAMADPTRVVEVTPLESGSFSSELIRVSPAPGVTPSAGMDAGDPRGVNAGADP